jgi:hypothetical protein
LTENSNLLNQTLQGADVNGEAGAVGIGLNSFLLVLAKFIDPDGDNLLKLRASQETERGILAGTLILCALNLFKKAVTKDIAEIREFLLVGKCAQGSHNLLPVGQIGIVYNVPEVLTHNRCEQTHIVRATGLLREVVFLSLLDALGTTTDGNHEGVRHAVLAERNIQSLLEFTEEQSTSDLLLCLSL